MAFKDFPLTDWISLTTRYTGNFDWTRAPLALDNDTLSVGNIVQNSRVVSWSGKLNFIALYNKVPYLKKINKNMEILEFQELEVTLQKEEKVKPSGEKSEIVKKKKEESEIKILDQFARLLMSVKSVMPLLILMMVLCFQVCQ